MRRPHCDVDAVASTRPRRGRASPRAAWERTESTPLAPYIHRMRIRSALRLVALFLGALFLAAAFASAAWASTPTCATLVDDFQSSFDDAVAYRVAVAVEQGDREVAYELAQQTRLDDGSWESETIERRGLRRPTDSGRQDGDATFGDVPIDCEGHEIRENDDGEVVLTLPAREGDESAITGWSIRFDRSAQRWLPLELIADFEARIVFIPVRGRFVTTLTDWRFEPR